MYLDNKMIIIVNLDKKAIIVNGIQKMCIRDRYNC